MTGEITLSGRVLPVGGIKEKVLAARRDGHPRGHPAAAEREERQRGPDDELRRGLTVHYVDEMDEVLKLRSRSARGSREAPRPTRRRVRD